MIEVTAEISGNHNGSLKNCLELIRQAKRLRVSSVKFQMFVPWLLAQRRVNSRAVEEALGAIPDVLSLWHLYEQTRTPQVWLPRLLKELDGYPWSASVFSIADLDFVMAHGCEQIKIASFELTDLQLLEAAAATGKPVVFSASSYASVDDVINALEATQRATHCTVLHATRYYDRECTAEELEHEKALYENLKIVVGDESNIGLSDHTQGNSLAIWCVRHGVDMIERHLKLQNVKTPDSAFSLTPTEMARMMEEIRATARSEPMFSR